MADKPDTEKFESWAVVEIMGHRKLAGLVSEQTIGGSALIRIDVPEIPADPQMTLDGGRASEAIPGFTKLYGVSSIYCITPCTEEFAREVVKRLQARPMQLAELPPVRSIGYSGNREFDDDFVDEYGDDY